MKIILDSNILFSALIKNSTTRKIIIEYEDFFLFPAYIFEELEEHKKELMQKSRMSSEDFENLLQLLLKKVIIVSKEDLNHKKEEAIELMKNIDLDDALFIACALASQNSVIWSDDKKLKQQTKIKILNTSEIIEYFKVE